MTPEFQGTHLWDRLGWAKQNLEPYRSEYCVVWEDPDNLDEPAKVTHPDPNWMACALNGGILPPVWVYWELKKDEAKPDFVKHTRGYLLHDTEPVKAMTEEEAIEYLIQKDIPESSTEREKPQPPHTITNSTVKIDMRARGRQGRIRVSCNAANTSWRWGSVRLAIQPDGRR